MRSPLRTLAVLALASAPLATAAVAQDPPPARPTTTTTTTRVTPAPAASATASRVIGTHHINRYAALQKVQEAVKSNPSSLSDWIILGELAHEVGVDSPPDQSGAYYRQSREAYEKALALAPDNPGLKAAVQFARDYEAGASRFEQIRNRATETYLAARRRDLAATDYVPAVRVYPSMMPPAMPGPGAVATIPPTATNSVSVAPNPNVGRTPTPATGESTAATTPARAVGAIPPDPTPAITPAPTNTTSTDIANFGVRQIYTSPYSAYQPYYVPQGSPYTYQQYTSSYYPAADTDAGPLPMTIQRYAQQRGADASRRPVDPAYTQPLTPAPSQRPIR